MAYLSNNPRGFLGRSVGSGQCVAYVQAAAHAPSTSLWRRGSLVQGNEDLAPGTVIATFDPNGRYGNHTDGRSHAAIYLGQDKTGIRVLDQWVSHRDGQTVPVGVHERVIRFGPKPRAENDGSNYYVVE